MKGKIGSLGEGSSSPLLPMFRASVASAPPNFLSASWLTNTNRGASRSSLSTIDSEEIREKDGSPEKNSDSTKEGSRSKRRKNLWKSGVEGQWHSLEALSRILGIMSLVCFSVGAGLTIVGFASRGLPVNASLLFQILGPVLLAAAFVTFLLGSVLGRLWKGEWQKRQQEMETLVRMKLEKLTKEILLQQHQQRLLTFPQQQFMSSESRSMLESIPLDVEAGVSKIAKRSRFFSRPGSLLNVSSSTETTTANSRRSSRLVNNNGSCSQVDQAIEGLSSALVRRDLERLGTGVLPTRKNNNFPSFDLPGIQISRIETLDLDQASGSSCCSAKRYIIVHSDVASSDFSFASEYSLLSTARSKSRSRSSNASLFDFSPRDSEWDADVSLGSRDSQTSITGRSSISGREYPVGFSKQYYPFHRASYGQPQQHLLLLPPGAKNLSGASNGASIDECPSSPRRHSSPVSQNYKRVGLGGGDRMDESFFPSDFDSNQSFASRLNLATRHPYSSCSPLLLKPSSGNNNDFSASNGGSGVSEATASTKGSESLDQSITRSQLFFQQFKYPPPMRKFSYEEQRRISWLRKRSYGDQSVISMKITEDSDDEAAEERDSFEASRPAIDDGDKTGKSEVDVQTISQADDKDTRHQMLKLTTKNGESVQLTQEDSTSQVQRTDSNEEKNQVAQIVEAQVDPRWRHFFDGSTSMAMVAAATVSSVVDKKRACLKRNTTDDSEVERRVAKLLKEIEFSATDSVEDCSKTTRDGVLSTRPILNFFPYDSKSSDGTTSLSLRARRDSFASKGRQQQTTSSSSSSQPFSFFASRQLSLHPPSRGIEVQTQTDEGLDRPKSPEVPEKEKSPTRKPEKRRTSKLIQNTSTESSSGVSIQNASSNAVQPEQTLSGGASKLKFFAKALPQVIAAATSAAAMECNRLVSAKNFAAKKRKRKQKSGNSEDAGGKS